MRYTKRLRYSVTTLLLNAAVALVLSSCLSVKLISDYDEATDKALTQLQQSTDDFVTKLATSAPSPDNSFDKKKDFYDAVDQQLRRLEFRVSSIPKNGATVKLVGDIRHVILGDGGCASDGASLRDLHCSAGAQGPSKTALQINQRNIDQTIRAALALELAKKQGMEQNK